MPLGGGIGGKEVALPPTSVSLRVIAPLNDPSTLKHPLLKEGTAVVGMQVNALYALPALVAGLPFRCTGIL